MSETTSNKIPEGVPEAIIAFAQRILDFDASLSGKERAAQYDSYLRMMNDLVNYGLDNGRRLRTPAMTGDEIEDICAVIVFSKNLIESVQREQNLRKAGYDYDPDIKRIKRSNLVWRMEDTDHKRIQLLVNEIRDLLQNTVQVEEKRLLSLLLALEAFQRRLHGRKPPRFSLRRLFDDDDYDY